MKSRSVNLTVVLALSTLLIGCAVKLPLPPSGEQQGRFGYIEGRVSYVPNIEAAYNFFTGNQSTSTPKTLKDK